MSGKKLRISDLAQATGLSRATIDRVLNGRPGVRAKTKLRVEKALKELGYAPDALTARRIAAANSLEVFVSEGANPFFEQLRAGIETSLVQLARAGLKVTVKGFDPYSPQTVVDCLKNVSAQTDKVITVGVDTPDVKKAINDLVERDVQVVTIVSDVPGSKRSAFVGQDNFVTGRTAGRLMLDSLPPEPCSVAVLLGHIQFRHLLDRQAGFQQIIGLERPDVLLVPTRPYGTDQKVAKSLVTQLLSTHNDLKGIYLAGGGQPHLVEELSTMAADVPVKIGHEATAVSRDHLRRGGFKFVLAHDVYEIGRKAVEAVLEPDITGIISCGIHIYVRENFPQIA